MNNSAGDHAGKNPVSYQLSAKIGVANVMTGSVRRAGQSVRIQLELRRASDEALLWSHTYAQELSDPLVLQSDIAENVARALQARESRGAYGGARFSTKSPQAFDLFLKARGLFKPGATSGEGMLQSAQLLKEALGLDPGFVSAASLLATIFTDLARGSPAPDQRVVHAADAKLYAEMAARLAPGGAGDAQLAFYYAVIEGEAAKALGLADNAIRALPNDAIHHNVRGIALAGLGRTAEALLSYRKARELDPLPSVFRRNELRALVALRRWDEFAAANASDPGPRASAAARMHRAAYELKGELPTSLDGMSPLERRTWLWLGRKFVEADIELEQARAGSPVADADRFALQNPVSYQQQPPRSAGADREQCAPAHPRADHLPLPGPAPVYPDEHGLVLTRRRPRRSKFQAVFFTTSPRQSRPPPEKAFFRPWATESTSVLPAPAPNPQPPPRPDSARPSALAVTVPN